MAPSKWLSDLSTWNKFRLVSIEPTKDLSIRLSD